MQCLIRTVLALILTEYEVISTTKGPDGEKVSIVTTNQTHTAVENLKPESRCGLGKRIHSRHTLNGQGR